MASYASASPYENVPVSPLSLLKHQRQVEHAGSRASDQVRIVMWAVKASLLAASAEDKHYA